MSVAEIIAVVLSAMALLVGVYRGNARGAPPPQTSNKELKGTINVLLADLALKQRQIDDLTNQLRNAEEELALTKDRIRDCENRLADLDKKKPPRVLLVATGDDEAILGADLRRLRGVTDRHNVRLSRLSNASKKSLRETISRYRRQGQPIRWVHMAVHAGPDGVLLSDGLAGPEWLSETFSDVKILVINGCESALLGDSLGVAETVITMREEVETGEAADFAEVFWAAVLEGRTGPEAFHLAIERSPTSLSEMAELHTWYSY